MLGPVIEGASRPLRAQIYYFYSTGTVSQRSGGQTAIVTLNKIAKIERGPPKQAKKKPKTKGSEIFHVHDPLHTRTWVLHTRKPTH